MNGGRLTERQREILKQTASPHGMRIYNHHEAAVMERLFARDFVIRSCNGTDKWHATTSGRAALAQQEGRE